MKGPLLIRTIAQTQLDMLSDPAPRQGDGETMEAAIVLTDLFAAPATDVSDARAITCAHLGGTNSDWSFVEGKGCFAKTAEDKGCFANGRDGKDLCFSLATLPASVLASS